MLRIRDKIKKYRKSKGYSHENMANDLGISQAAYTNLENGNTQLTVERLMHIAHILERDLVDFFPDQETRQAIAPTVKAIQDSHQGDVHLEKSRLYDMMEQKYQETISVLERQIEVLQRVIDRVDGKG